MSEYAYAKIAEKESCFSKKRLVELRNPTVSRFLTRFGIALDGF